MDENWHVGFIGELPKKEFLSLPIDLIAEFLWIIDLMRTYGLENVGMPYIKHVQGKLWEIRAKGKNQTGRGIYIALTGKRAAISRIFVKITPQTPQQEIELALRRLKEFADEEGEFIDVDSI
jgi:phage-related protein